MFKRGQFPNYLNFIPIICPNKRVLTLQQVIAGLKEIHLGSANDHEIIGILKVISTNL